MATSTRVFLLGAASVLVFAGLGVAPAAAGGPLGCGSVITTNTVLQADIGPCNSNGLVIGADNITLDLNGHTVSGNAQRTGEGVGVLVRGRQGVTIRNGTIRSFDTGLLLIRSSTRATTASRVVGLRLLSNGLPQPSFAELGNGIALLGAHDNHLERNTASRNVAAGISMEESNGNVINGNTVSDNGVVDPERCVVGAGTGIRLLTFASRNTMVNNVVTGNTSAGVNLAFDNTDNLIQNNIIQRNQSNGLRTSGNSDGNRVTGNLVVENGTQTVLGRDPEGICRPSTRAAGSGIVFDFSDFNVADRNLVMGNALDGIRVGGGDETLPVVGNRVDSNNVRNNGRNGIVVTCTTDFPPTTCLTFDQRTTIVSNVAVDNGGAAAGTRVFTPGGFLVGNFDLLDTNHQVNAGYTGPACDNNVWRGNTFETAFPSCTRG